MTAENNIEQKPLTVSAAMTLAKSALEQVSITLVGEVSEVSNKPGYKAVYFSVKDEAATMPCMMWMNRYHSANVELKVGALVQMTGKFTLYAPKGRMNFDVFSLSLAGEGNLRQQVAERARRLKSEGLMDTSRKRALPEMPEIIGLVTSPRGAAVHDVLRTLRRRWPQATVLLAGVTVEGNEAPSALIQGLEVVAQAGAQVVLLVRGGGSFEDLMPFNDEELARAIAFSPVPVVTGIGHEPDTSIADMVADIRASTPTAAAEAVSPYVVEMDAQIAHAGARMHKSLISTIEQNKLRYDYLTSRPVFSDPQQLFATEAQTLDIAEERMQRAIPAGIERDTQELALIVQRLSQLIPSSLQEEKHYIDRLHERLRLCSSSMLTTFESIFSLHAARLEDLSPLSILSRGFGIVRNEEGTIISSHTQTPVGSHIHVQLSDGSVECDVTQTHPAEIAQIEWKD